MNSCKKLNHHNQQDSLDGGFLQSSAWLKFQESVGRKILEVTLQNSQAQISESDSEFKAGLIEHKLPIVGKYFYIPRGSIFSVNLIKSGIQKIISEAKKENAGWIRLEPADNKTLELIRESYPAKIARAPHDVQPKEIFVIDISKSPEQLLEEMKSKTRYNIKLAQKRGVIIRTVSDFRSQAGETYVAAFLALTREMAARHGIAAHGDQYYRKMIQALPKEMISIYIAEYQNKIIAANLVLFYGNFATYLHGASGNEQRNLMAPFLLQWQAILDAKNRGCEKYDFGGVQTPGAQHQKHSDLVGVTNFKLGFSPLTKPIEFPGSYDIIINPRAYALYRGLQKAKSMIKIFKKN